MFDSGRYKKKAKEQLRGRITEPVLFTLLITAICAVMNMEDIIRLIKNHNLMIITCKKSMSMTLLTLFITGSCILAYTRVFLIMRRTYMPVSFSDFIEGFSMWMQGSLGFLWYVLWVWIWALLFFIPGIIKAISYSQMFFVLAENPKIGFTKAMRISKILTNGHKGDLCIMGLSFMGWEILSLATLGILGLWIKPYEHMSFTNAYFDMKKEALDTKRLTPEDFE